ncbi:MAG TPA: hypothetical protein VD999_02800 [Vitreimonas sp.]|nr:hypothetical protein [Vitreimonas sp.]
MDTASASFPIYRNSNFVIALNILSFFIPFFMVVPLLIMITGPVYDAQTKVKWAKTETVGVMCWLALILIIWLWFALSGWQGVDFYLVGRTFAHFLMAMGVTVVIDEQLKRSSRWLRVLVGAIVFLVVFILTVVLAAMG